MLLGRQPPRPFFRVVATNTLLCKTRHLKKEAKNLQENFSIRRKSEPKRQTKPKKKTKKLKKKERKKDLEAHF